MDDLPRLVRSEHLYDGRVVGLRADALRFDDGSEHRVEVVEHGASMGIVATPAPGEIVLVRQYRHPAGAALWEIPAGTAERDEDPMEGARRELLEETGYRARRIAPIGSFWTSPGFCSEVMHLFHASELTAGEPQFDDDERIEVGRFTLQAAWRLVADGVADAKTLVALFWLQSGEKAVGSFVRR